MTSTILNKAGKALFEKNIEGYMERYTPADPMYEEYTDKKGRKKRRKRALPPGLSARDAKILKSVQRRAHYLDKGFSFGGVRFGWTFVIGLVPMVGDFADAGLNYLLVVRKARQAELPSWLVRRMLVNNSISALAGLIPVAGDIVLAVYKANSRNAALLEEFLRIRGEEFMKLENKKKSEGKPDKLLSKSDLEQVKPGAGADTKSRSGGESTDVAEGTMPQSSLAAADIPSKKNSVLRWRPSNGNKGKGKEEVREKEKESLVMEERPSDRGKFVEDVSSSGGGSHSRNGTLRKKRFLG
jgi:hypothetical protein